MIKTLDSQYRLLSHVHFSESVISDLYASIKEKVAKQLGGIKSFAATTDMWSSIGLRPYIRYTFHYIDNEFTLQSPSLSTSFLPEDHNASILGDETPEE